MGPGHGPKAPHATRVGNFLSTFDRQTGLGQRGFAIARCLVDLGLRACAVAAIQLRDVNWREGVIAISGGKSRRVIFYRFQLPPEKRSSNTCESGALKATAVRFFRLIALRLGHR